MATSMRDSLTFYNTLATKRYGIYKKVDFAMNFTHYLKDAYNYTLLKQMKEKGINVGLPLIYINFVNDNLFNPNSNIILRDGRQGIKIGLLELHQELLEIEQMTDFIVMKYRNELDAFITSAKAEVLK